MKEGSIQQAVFAVLKDKKWHCRGHEYTKVPSGQLAGGGGIQGLQRGTKKRPGYEIETERKYCSVCGKKITWDRWTGRLKVANPAAGVPKALVLRILAHYDYTDAIEQRRREAHELIVDHRVPMERWGAAEETLSIEMPVEEIERKFQLLKKDASGNHNLLKSRACENCVRNGKRGTPLGIQFFYIGGEDWPANVPQRGPGAELGCIGCGWYDFATWRAALNARLASPSTATRR